MAQFKTWKGSPIPSKNLEFLFGVVNVILRQPHLHGAEVVTPRSCYLRRHLVVKAASTRRVSYGQFGTIHFEPRVCESLRESEVLGAQVDGKFLINYIVKGAPYECPKLGTYIWCGTSNLALVKGTKLDKSRLLYEARQAT